MLLWRKHFPMEKHHSKQIIWDHVARIVFYTSIQQLYFISKHYVTPDKFIVQYKNAC